MSFYKKIFENVLNEADEVQPSDAEVFEKGFDDEQAFNQVESEVENTIAPVQDLTAVIDAADKYSKIITDKIIPILVKIQTECLNGIFANQGIDLPNISGINEDLGKLAQAISGRARDAAIESEQAKNAK